MKKLILLCILSLLFSGCTLREVAIGICDIVGGGCKGYAEALQAPPYVYSYKGQKYKINEKGLVEKVPKNNKTSDKKIVQKDASNH